MKRILALLIAATCTPGYAEQSKENFYTQTERLVVHLERQVAPNTFVPAGTGFFVAAQDGSVFIVTARHVAEIGDLRARVPALLSTSRSTDIVELRMPHDRWTFHPNSGDADVLPVDVAVMKVGGMKDREVVTFAYCPTKCPDGQYNQVASDPSPPDLVDIFGFPENLGFRLTEQRPMMRHGAVALVADHLFVSVSLAPNQAEKFVSKGAYLVDARMFPGNSGGPVIVANPLTPMRLGGLVTGTNTDLDYGIVTPVSQIAETIDAAKNTLPNVDAWWALK
jgi:hypothetical protein